MSDLGDSLDMPFEENPSPAVGVPLDDGKIASGMVIMAAAMPIPGAGVKPCLIYRFANPDGSGFYPPIVFVADADQITKTVPLTRRAADAAVAAARQANA